MSKDPQNLAKDSDKQYYVEKILDRKIDKQECYYYHIKWIGYTQTTWQPLSNLIGAQGVEKMIADFEKTFEKKAKNNWSKGLQGWANVSKNPTKQMEKIIKQSLDETIYELNETDIIDLDKVDQPTAVKKKKADGNPFIGSRVRMKITTNKNQRYPFQKAPQISQCPVFMKKIIEIKKFQLIDGQQKCLVTIKNPQIHDQWLPNQIVRIIAPELLLQNYEKVYQQNQSKIN